MVTQPISPVTGVTQEDQYKNLFGALAHENSLAWSPDGSKLAFAGIQASSSVDLFLYSSLDRTVRRLSSGPAQTVDISWSPGGSYIVSTGATDMHWAQGGDDGPATEGVWVVRPDGNGLHEILSQPNHFPNRLGWVNDQSYAYIFGNMACWMYGLSFMDVQKPNHYSLVPGPMRELAFDPNTGAALVGVSEIASGDARFQGCGPKLDPGYYLFSVFGNKPSQKLNLAAPPLESLSNYFLAWSPEARRFFIASDKGITTIDLRGRATQLNLSAQEFDVTRARMDFVRASPNGTELVLFNDLGLWLSGPDGSIKPIFTASNNSGAPDVLWLPDGSGFLFTTENKLYRYLEKVGRTEALTGPLSAPNFNDWKLYWILP